MNTAPLTAPKQHVASIPGVCGGKPCVAGTRVRVWDIAAHAQAGDSPDEILIHFPQLELSDVYASLAYYYDNRQEIEQQAAEDEHFAEQLHKTLGPGPLEQKVLDQGSQPKLNPGA